MLKGLKSVGSYFASVIFNTDPIIQFLTALGSAFAWIAFPDKAMITPAFAVVIVAVLDLITKYYAKAQKCRDGRNILYGFWRAIKVKELRSATMFRGTIRKLISYMTIMILSGLAYKFGEFQGIASAFSVLAYALMFLRESQSVIENLIEAGHTDLKWLLDIIKKRRAALGDEEDKDK